MTPTPLRSERAWAASTSAGGFGGGELEPGVQGTWTLPTTSASVSLARAEVRALCDDVPAPWIDDVVLATSELVTNAVLHGQGDVELRVRRSSHKTRIEVTDTSMAQPAVGRGCREAENGRGLLIVSAVTTSWGVTPGRTADTKTVWCEVDHRQPTDEGGLDEW